VPNLFYDAHNTQPAAHWLQQRFIILSLTCPFLTDMCLSAAAVFISKGIMGWTM